MMSILSVVFAACFITAASEARTLQNTAVVEFVAASGRQCQQACKNPLVFGAVFSKQPASFSCRINLENGEVSPGYQAGTNTCKSAYYNTAVESTNYDCACLPDGHIPGLDNSLGGSCTQSCTSGLDGSPGAALVDGVGHICMPSSEMGVTNHMGYTDSGKCNYVPGGSGIDSGLSTTLFSCACSFVGPSASKTVASAPTTYGVFG